MEQTANTISFPGLGLDFEVNRVAFSIGSLPVYWYGILIAAGFILAVLYAGRRAKEFGVDADRFLDVIIGGAIGGIVGARAYFVLLQWDYYGKNLSQIFNTRSGGMAIYGGLIGGVLVGLLMCKIRKVKCLPAIDLAVGGFFIGQAIGRWGNFVNIEAFGSNTSLPWGMSSPVIANYLTQHEAELEAIGMDIDPNMPVHPTFLYESLWCLLGFAFLAWYTKRRKFDGELTLLYMVWYGAGRAVIEGLRTDSLMIPGTALRASQVLAAAMAIVAAVIWVVKTTKVRKAGGRQLFVDTPEGQLIVRGEFYNRKDEAQQPAVLTEKEAAQSDAAETAPSDAQGDAAETVPSDAQGDAAETVPSDAQSDAAETEKDSEQAQEKEQQTAPSCDEQEKAPSQEGK